MSVEKRCDCAEARWPKCLHPWYLKKFRYRQQEFAPNLTRYVEVFLPDQAITAKTDALKVAEVVRTAIRANTYVAAKGVRPVPPVVVVTATRTLDQVAGGDAVVDGGDDFFTLAIAGDANKKPNSKTNDAAILKRLRATKIGGVRLGARMMATITMDDLVAYRRSVTHLAQSTWNKHRTLLGQLWAWAVWKGHIPTDIIATAAKPQRRLIRRGKVAQRVRRIDDTLYHNLLEAAREVKYGAIRLGGLIAAAMETGCRLGELLALQWADVNLAQRTWYVRAEEIGGGKTGEGRPIELSQVLIDLLRPTLIDPAGRPFPRSAYVFGDAYGGRVKSIRKAWETAVLRAHNIEPDWQDNGDHTPACRAHLNAIDLHFHDLRHEAGCRWLESRQFDLSQVSKKLGHTSIAQTSTYLHPTGESLRTSQQLYDQGRPALPPLPVRRPKRASRGDKLGTNFPQVAKTGMEPRLVKGNKAS